MKVTKNENSWTYNIPGFSERAHFEECTIGPYKGKTFVIGDNKVAEVNVTASHTARINKVVIVDEMDVITDNLTFAEVFRSVARKTAFGINEGERYEGYTYNRYWNGFEMPMFEKNVAMEILKNMEKYKNDEDGLYLTYDEENDTFFYHDNSDDDNNEPYGEKGHDIVDENGNVHHVYDIGAGCWVWDEITEDD